VLCCVKIYCISIKGKSIYWLDSDFWPPLYSWSRNLNSKFDLLNHFLTIHFFAAENERKWLEVSFLCGCLSKFDYFVRKSWSSFSRAIGYILRGFLTEVSTVIECKRRCVIGANCLWLNILRIADGSFVCHLSSKRKESGAKEQFELKRRILWIKGTCRVL
jgi:hypothetical protein